MAELSWEDEPPLLTYTLFAFLSGITALIYQVVWTREVALFLGSQIEAISIVLVAFFGGLAAGARYFGARVDRVRAPLRLFGILEGTAGALAAASPALLQWLAASPLLGLSSPARFAAAAAALFPVAFLLGGTAPALLRGSVREIAHTVTGVGWIVGSNTAGAVLGVGVAIAAIPAWGLRTTLSAAGATALLLGAAAFFLARPVKHAASSSEPPFRIPPTPLAAAFAAGIATLAYEVLAARAAALLLGSTLYAWGCVLALLLAGLALGTAIFSKRAGRTTQPELELGLIESAAALAIAAELTWLVPDYALPAAGLSGWTGGLIALFVFPPALLMGGAFPYLVRLSVGSLGTLGRAFGTVSGVNTAGGIAGSLLAPFVFLPTLGLLGSLLLCACLNALLGAFFLSRGTARPRQAWTRAALAALLVGLAAAPAFIPPALVPGRRVIHVDDGRQASVAVVRSAVGRDLIVDGDPEAGTAWDALETEVLLALVPLALNPEARSFLEVGLGSGITLGTAARFPLERIDCVEIAQSVISSGRFFEPENNGITRADDPRVEIIHADGRAYLARHRGAYDIVVANTLHPWSVGATGLYSREYFARVRGALRPGGIAAQWVPIGRIGDDQIAAIARTFFSVFEDGGVFWGAENLILIGSDGPVIPPFGMLIPRGEGEELAEILRELGLHEDPGEVAFRRIASASGAREALGAGRLLTDDVPWLEMEGARRRSIRPAEGTLALLDQMGAASARDGVAAPPIALWIESRLSRARGLDEKADRLERRAEEAGLGLAKRARLRRLAGLAAEDLRLERPAAGIEMLRALLAEAPDQRDAGYALAMALQAGGDSAAARETFEGVMRDHPGFAPGWNALGVLMREAGDRAGAREAFERALEADRYFPEALANAGLVAAEVGDYPTALRMLGRLRAITPLGPTPELRALESAMGEGQTATLLSR